MLTVDTEPKIPAPVTSPVASIQKIFRDEAGRLVARLGGQAQPMVDVRVARCFPWSQPEKYLSILDKDGKEVTLLPSLDALDAGSRKIVEEELRDKVFYPKIKRVISCKREFGMMSIVAETDRGQVTFVLQSREDVRVLSASRVLFRDPDGNMYELADSEALDTASRKYLEDYL